MFLVRLGGLSRRPLFSYVSSAFKEEVLKMTPIIIPLAAFRIFDAVIRRLKVPFSDRRLFAEFSSFVEAFTLCDQVQYFNIGAFNFEWSTGSILPTEKITHNPFEVFYGLNFIGEASVDISGNKQDIIKLRPEDELCTIYDEEYTAEPYAKAALFMYLATYVNAYNGNLGRVVVKEFPIVQNLLVQAIEFKGSQAPVYNDPLIIRAYEQLKVTYKDKLTNIFETAVTPVVIPPITSILLSRLPDGVQDPKIVLREIINIRHRRAFDQPSAYDPKQTFDDVIIVNVEKVSFESYADTFKRLYFKV